jgi:hypothetical protein
LPFGDKANKNLQCQLPIHHVQVNVRLCLRKERAQKVHQVTQQQHVLLLHCQAGLIEVFHTVCQALKEHATRFAPHQPGCQRLDQAGAHAVVTPLKQLEGVLHKLSELRQRLVGEKVTVINLRQDIDINL